MGKPKFSDKDVFAIVCEYCPLFDECPYNDNPEKCPVQEALEKNKLLREIIIRILESCE